MLNIKIFEWTLEVTSKLTVFTQNVTFDYDISCFAQVYVKWASMDCVFYTVFCI